MTQHLYAATAIDLFAGAGGATQGLRDAGFDVRAAVEIDADAAATWVLNHPGKMLTADIRSISGEQLLKAAGVERGQLDLLKACPPCQGFSSLRGGSKIDEVRNDLVLDTVRVVREVFPRAVLLENVPGLMRDGRFARLLDEMRDLGYVTQNYVIDAADLGVPQRRRRLVVIATRIGAAPPERMVELIPPSKRRPAKSAGDALDELSRVQRADDPSQVWRVPKDVVARRIRAVPINGTRFDLPEELQLDCHKRLIDASGRAKRTATGSYGRVRAMEPAPTMTTRCTTPACGAFIHPTEHRGISLREAAAFQTFPPSYGWVGSYGSIERQIGNAVPVWMAESLGRAVLDLLNTQQIAGPRDAAA